MSIVAKASFKKFIFSKITLLVLLGFSISACTISTKNQSPYYHITQMFKDYCFFDVGSNWIYQNDQTGDTYHYAVSKITTYIGFHVKDPLGEAYSYDAIEMWNDTNDLHLTKGIITAGISPINNEKSNDLYRIFWDDSSFVLAFAPGYPMGEEQRLGGQEGLYTNIEELPTFSLNNKDYTNVYHTQVIKAESASDTARLEFYFAPHVGLIKFSKVVKGQTTSYSLKEAKIIQ